MLKSIADMLPSDEEIARRKAERRDYAAWVHSRPGCPSVISLAYWLQVASEAGVPAVPGEHVGDFATDALLATIDGDAPEEAERLHDIAAALPPGHVLRWDVCAGLEVKEYVNAGRSGTTPPWAENPLAAVMPDDPRLVDILMDAAQAEVGLYRRPWVAPMLNRTEDGAAYPIEFRVFVADGGIQGVSYYYPQCGIEETDEVNGYLDALLVDAARMVAKVRERGDVPTHPCMVRGDFEPQTPQGNAFTLDFLVRGDGQPLFLEGGPGHFPRWGAHPCCFLPNRTRGLALQVVEPPEETE